jgi:hypothetical protein
MAIALAQRLITASENGEKKLTASERRHCVQFLAATQPDLTNEEVAEIFKVSERQIRFDRQNIREAKAKFLKDEIGRDIALVIADIAMDYEQQVRDIEKSKAKCPLGSKEYLAHCNSIFEMRLKMVKSFQDIGMLPKNLGSMAVSKFEFKAEIGRDGSVAVVQSEKYDKDKAAREALEAEFTDVRMPALLPAHEEIHDLQNVSAGKVRDSVSPADGQSADADSSKDLLAMRVVGEEAKLQG